MTSYVRTQFHADKTQKLLRCILDEDYIAPEDMNLEQTGEFNKFRYLREMIPIVNKTQIWLSDRESKNVFRRNVQLMLTKQKLMSVDNTMEVVLSAINNADIYIMRGVMKQLSAKMSFPILKMLIESKHSSKMVKYLEYILLQQKPSIRVVDLIAQLGIKSQRAKYVTRAKDVIEEQM